MNKHILFALANAFIINAHGQKNSLPQVIRAQNTLTELARGGVSPNSISYGIPMPQGEMIGDFYLDKKWNKSTILMYEKDQLLEGYLTRFNIEDSWLEIKLPVGVRIIDVDQFKSIVWVDSLTSLPRFFLNAKSYSFNGVKLMGLLEVLVDGNYPLFKKITNYVKPATYNVALDVGSKDTKILKKEIYYFAEENKLIEVRRKKDLVKYFEVSKSGLESYISANRLTVSKEKDLVAIFLQINK